MSLIIRGRNKFIHGAYRRILKPVFFRNDPEAVHDRMSRMGVRLGSHRFTKAVVRGLFGYRHPMLEQDVLGIHFANPIGLSAGFDKNAELTDILPAVGFGFAEVGSVTGKPCAGNPQPRLWRLPESKSLVVWYGLKNDGCDAISQRLAGKKFDIPVGVSVAMTNCAENVEIGPAIEDFAYAFKTMEPVSSYITVNISCPNTMGGQPFVDPANLERLFARLDAIPTEKPIFIKLSPDMTDEQIDALLAVVARHRIHGLICTNLTKKREGNPHILDKTVPQKGGMSGKVVQEKADDLLARLYTKTRGKYVLVGCGGVFTAEDAYRKIRLGATLIQLITGMIYEGPQVISEINRGLVELVRRDGYSNVREAIGADTC